MSKAQREAIDALLRRPGPEGPWTVETMREGFAGMMAAMPVTDEVATSPMTLGGRPALLVEPRGGAAPGTILYWHGGSFVAGSPQTSLSLTANLVAGTRTRAVSLDYRLAPEHPFPAAIDDGVAAYRDLLAEGAEPASIAFAGDSAGGGLCVATCLKARDAGLPPPGAIATFSGSFDATRSGQSISGKADVDPVIARETLARIDAMYLGGQDPRQPLLSPAIVGELAGFPPMLLQTGTNEVLLDDSARLAERARDADVDVILDVVAGVPHTFQFFAGQLDEADDALGRAALFLTQHLSRRATPSR